MQRYRHSGSVPLGGVIKSLLFGSLAAILGGVLYAYAVAWIPLMLLNVLFAAVFAVMVGGGVNIGVRSGKIRSRLAAGVLVVLCMALGLYVYWGASMPANNGALWRFGLRLWSPEVIFRFGAVLFENGSWGLDEDTPIKSWPLVAVWIIEGGLLVAISWLTAQSALDEPFCERCQEWTSSPQELALLEGKGDEPVWQRIVDGDFPALGEVPLHTSDDPQFVRLGLSSCPKCTESNFLSLIAVQLTVDDKGNVKAKERPLLKDGILSPGQVEIVRHLAEEYDALVAATDEPLGDEPLSDEAEPTEIPSDRRG